MPKGGGAPAGQKRQLGKGDPVVEAAKEHALRSAPGNWFPWHGFGGPGRQRSSEAWPAGPLAANSRHVRGAFSDGSAANWMGAVAWITPTAPARKASAADPATNAPRSGPLAGKADSPSGGWQNSRGVMAFQRGCGRPSALPQ